MTRAEMIDLLTQKVISYRYGGDIVTAKDFAGEILNFLESHGMTPPDSFEMLDDGWFIKKEGWE